MELRREVDIQLEADIVVVGGGTAGSAAAVAAARKGKKVILVEENNALGGTSTTGGVCEFFASTEGVGNIFSQVKKELNSYEVLYGRYFNNEYLKIIWQLLAEKAGVEILFHASVFAVDKTGNKINKVYADSASKLIAIKADVFVDTTGEGDLGELAGAEFMKGEEGTEKTLHMSLTFILNDTGEKVKPYLPEELEKIRLEEELPGLDAHIELPDNRIYVNMTKIMNHDPVDPLSLSKAEIEARKQLARILYFLQTNYHPTYKLAASGAKIGIREGRRIVGDYIITENDILGDSPLEFEDSIAVATSQIDFHSLDEKGTSGRRERIHPFAIPYRSIVSRDLKNMLMAGKNISGDQTTLSSYRMIPTCCAMGQAAGTAACLAVNNRVSDVREINIDKLQQILMAEGIELDPSRHQPFAPSCPEEEE